ncbi:MULTISPECIES: LysR family transcriptional regulator [Actinosynnema]|uniref:LysR family transcriptional regulator n=1 Tax=Actinosynnema TaxID=40566 RepID=UPI0020A5E15D|nr:LysR family transcriptional regulator [Actinosynnema pretiosum]MCP2096578.1 DNA-binding transcriptional regulator, LysR family [Actinosynnema pretiosum]
MPADDLDLRLVRCFTTVAEHLHLGRAALALHTTQPALSRQLSRLERQVGARLLDRSPRGTALTEAGLAFLPAARALLDSAAEAVAGARAVGRDRITVGYGVNLIVTPAVVELRRRHPDADVRARHVEWDRVRASLLERRVDAVVARLPLDADGLRVAVLREEPRALLVATGHRLAGRRSVTLADVADEPMPKVPDERWNAFWRVDPRPGGGPAPDGPLVESVEDKAELVASGQAVAIVPDGEHLRRVRPGLVAVPLEGVEPSRVVLATRAGERGGLVADFRALAATHLVG